jgi:hypothetical protein
LAPIAAGTEKRAGALLDADLYNGIVEYAAKMEVDLAWIVREAFREFIIRHKSALKANPKQLALDLKLRQNDQKITQAPDDVRIG